MAPKATSSQVADIAPNPCAPSSEGAIMDSVVQPSDSGAGGGGTSTPASHGSGNGPSHSGPTRQGSSGPAEVPVPSSTAGGGSGNGGNNSNNDDGKPTYGDRVLRMEFARADGTRGAYWEVALGDYVSPSIRRFNM